MCPKLRHFYHHKRNEQPLEQAGEACPSNQKKVYGVDSMMIKFLNNLNSISKAFKHFSTQQNDLKILENLKTLVDTLRTTNSINSKVEIIKSKPELVELLLTIYSPDVRFNIKSTSITRYMEKENAIINNMEIAQFSLEDLLKMLKDRVITGKAAALKVISYIKKYHEYEDLIKNVIDKNLKARIGYDLIQRVAINLETKQDQESEIVNKSTYQKTEIPCVLGHSIENHMKYFEDSFSRGEKWFISRKYDGIRAFIVFDHLNDSIEVLSRNKKPINGINPTVLDVLRRSFLGLNESIVLDGELVFINQENESRDDFSKSISIVKSLEAKPIEGLQYKAFDIISCKDEIFSERVLKLKAWFSNLNYSNFVKIVNQELITVFNYDQLISKANELGYEGFMLRRDVLLRDGRSRDLLKIKPFYDDEFRVIDYELGPMRMINELEGVEKVELALLSIVINFKDNRVNVGSGFTNSERIKFAKDPSQILDKIVTVRYQSESKVLGRENNSLRFPIFKALHGKIRTE